MFQPFAMHAAPTKFRRIILPSACALLFGWLVLLSPFPALAQERLPPVDTEEIYRRLEQQEAELKWLREQLLQSRAASESPAPALSASQREEFSDVDVATPPADFTSANNASAAEIDAIIARLEALEKSNAAKSPDDGWVDMSGDKWNVKLGGHVQLDYIVWPKVDPPIPAQNYFEFRRLRLLADGTGYGMYDFRLQIDIEPESGDGVPTPVTDVKDAYLSANDIPYLQRWRIGNFFVPFGLEQVTNDTNNIFLERSIPTSSVFTGDREVGTAIYGCTPGKNMSWATGIFFDKISESLKERIDDNQGTRISGRLTWLPYYDEPSNGRYLIHTGVGVFWTDPYDGVSRFRTRPQIHEGPYLIDTGILPTDTFITGNIELATVWGPFSVQSELYTCNVNLTNGTMVNLNGAYVYASYFLTGENRIYERFGQHGAQFGRNVPYTNFFIVPGCIGPGAWELKARMSYVDFDDVNEGRYHDLTVGFNWYWSDRTRIMFDWIHPITSAETTYGATVSDIIGMRFDFNW